MYLYVPCGTCADCLRNKKNEWFFRSMIEYQDVLSQNGCCIFITLTYAPEHLPVFTLPSGVECQGFNKRHIHNFVKYFRIFLTRRGLDSHSIKYLICSEYGEHTKRPHYHGLLFLPFYLHWSLLQDTLKACWKYGFVICSKLGWYIQSPKGLRYASKYIVKDISYYNDVLKDYLSSAKTSQDRKYLLEPYKDYLPNHWQSVGFGESFIYSHILHNENPAKYLFDNRYNLNVGDNENVKIPRYYHLKLEKARNKAFSRALGKVVLDRSSIGFDVEIMKHRNRLENEYSLFKSLTLETLTLKFPVYEEIKDIYERNVNKGMSKHPFFVSASVFNRARTDCINSIVGILRNIDCKRLAIYHSYLRFYPLLVSEDPSTMFDNFDQIVHDIIYTPACQPELNELLLQKDVVVAQPLKDRDIDKYNNWRPCCESLYFDIYEQFCLHYDFFNYCISLSKESVSILKKKRKDMLSRDLRGNKY